MPLFLLSLVHSFFCSTAIVGIFTACPDYARARVYYTHCNIVKTRGVSGHAPQSAKYCAGPGHGVHGARGVSNYVKSLPEGK